MVYRRVAGEKTGHAAVPALLIVVAQLIVAYVIELLGLFGVEKEPLEWRKVIGMIIAIVGVAIFQWK